jgi:hypothetical protein
MNTSSPICVNAELDGRSDPSPVTRTRIVGLALLGTILSIASQGFHFNVGNNVYHIPVVLKLFDLNQFSHDPFYQSLRNFVSLVWPILGLVATPANVAWIFFGAHFVSRLLLYLACLTCLYRLGLRTFRTLTVSILTLAVGHAFVGYSMIGDTGLQIDCFTHTELTYPFILFSLLLAADGRHLQAFAVNGLTLDINAFVGVWMAVVLLLMLFVAPSTLRKKITQLLSGGALQMLIALPIIVWILHAVQEPGGAPFDYRTFIASYFPKHFLIQASSAQDLVLFAMTCASGGIALWLLGPAARPWRIAFLGFLGLFGLGTILPLVTSSRLLLNLLFLRIDGVIVLLSLLFIAPIAVQIALRRDWRVDGGLAFTILATVALGDWRLTAIGLALLAYDLNPASKSVWASPRLVSLFCVLLGTITVLSQVGVRPAFQSHYLIAAAMCFVVGLLEGAPVLVSLAAVIASVNFPILCAGAVIGLGVAIVWRDRSILWLVACTALSGMIQVVLGGGGFKAALSAALVLSGALAFLGRDRLSKALRFRMPGRVAAVALALFSVLLLWCAGQRATFVWIQLPRDPGTAEERSWKYAQQWARFQSPQEAVFLVPPNRQGFQLGSERNVWVDWRQGAAVMWSPSFYARWMARFPEVARLKSRADFNAYAAAHGIDYYVVERQFDTGNPPRETPVYSNAAFEIYRLNPSGR